MNLEPLEIYALLIANFVLVWMLVKLVCNGFILIASAIYLHKFDQVDDVFTSLVNLKFGKPGAFGLIIALAVTGVLSLLLLDYLRVTV
uniref:Uncharacterized protein n=1 Tax=Pseudomonas phage Cygsa01 TaxID=3138529 RepID=A0AAU6W4H7_9VIRU